MIYDTFHTYRHPDQSTAPEHHDFGLCDERGRKIGAFVLRCTVTVARVMRYDDTGEGVPANLSMRDRWLEDQAAGIVPRKWSYHEEATEPAYGFSPHATRNGKRYGALQSWSWFPSEAEREAAVTAYLQGAHKRAHAKTRTS